MVTQHVRKKRAPSGPALFKVGRSGVKRPNPLKWQTWKYYLMETLKDLGRAFKEVGKASAE